VVGLDPGGYERKCDYWERFYHFSRWTRKIFLHQLLEAKLRQIGFFFFFFFLLLESVWVVSAWAQSITKNRTQIFTSQTKTKISISKHGNLFSSVTLSALFFLTKTLQEQSLSFLAVQETKNHSTNSLVLPKDVCPWWVSHRETYIFVFLYLF